MKTILTKKQRQALIDAGFPRQTVALWMKGTKPRTGNLILLRQILGKNFFKKTRRNTENSGKSSIPGNLKTRKET